MRRGRIAPRLGALVGAVLLLCADASARPGGGGSFGGKSGGGSSGGSRPSSGPSRPSSGSGSRPSGGSSPKSSAPSEVWAYRATSGKARAADRAGWSPGAPSPYGPAAARPAAWPTPEDDTGVIVATLIFLLAIAGGLFALFVWALVAFARRRRVARGWSTSRPPSTRADLDAIRSDDPDFSIALFEDFLYALYAEAHTARGAGRLEQLSAYLRPAARQALAQRGNLPVGSIVVGAMRFPQVMTDAARYGVMVEYEANYAETPPGGHEQAYWVLERWQLSRAKTARSRPPDRVRVFDCPGCGAALDRMVGGTCRYCNRAVDTGEHHWVVDAIHVVSIEARGPMLTGTTEEQGTDLPTVRDPSVDQQLAAVRTRDPAFDPAAFQRRVGLVFQTMQAAWSSLHWERARPFLSDNLFQAQLYWIHAYRRAGLRNVTERTRITRIDLARATSDRWFDAVTVRVFATGLDFTLRDADGAVVGGNRSRERDYSEYWTLLRGTGAKGPTRTEAVCPKCGAALQVSMAGLCEHCGVKVNSGEFDWVLARIEQDEVYA